VTIHLHPTVHLHPTAELAERVLLPGDPGRALRLAQELLTEPKMFNHNRGLWGYTGAAAVDGEPLTIQSTGMGGPSTAIVASELISLGARRLLRVGTCGALSATLKLGQLLIVTEAIADDGTSRALGAADRVPSSPTLLLALRSARAPTIQAAGARTPTLGSIADGPVVSTDLFYDAEDREPGWVAAGAIAVEMEAATLFRLAERRGVEAGAVLVVSDRLVPERIRIGPDELHEGELRLGRLAAAALA
jgi:DeoD family purine-nucleoside phosphorylase